MSDAETLKELKAAFKKVEKNINLNKKSKSSKLTGAIGLNESTGRLEGEASQPQR